MNPLVWCAHVKAQFTIRGIFQQGTKFDYVIISLTLEYMYITEVSDLTLQLPTATPYNTLKQ